MSKHIIAGFALIALSSAIGVIAAGGVLVGLDTAMLRALSVAARPDWVVVATQFLSSFGNLGARGVTVLLVIAALLTRDRWRSGILYVAVVTLSITGHMLAKVAWARERPRVVPWLDSPHDMSFPSGHAAATMVVLLLAAMLFDRYRLHGVAIALSVAIGLTRPMLGVHWPSDVVGGWLWGAGFALIGAGVARSLGLLDRKYQRGAMRIAPSNRTSSPLK